MYQKTRAWDYRREWAMETTGRKWSLEWSYTVGCRRQSTTYARIKKVQGVMRMRQICNPMLFMINDWVFCYNKHMDLTKPYNALSICLLEARLKEAFQICQNNNVQTWRSKRYFRQVSENFLSFISSNKFRYLSHQRKKHQTQDGMSCFEYSGKHR